MNFDLNNYIVLGQVYDNSIFIPENGMDTFLRDYRISELHIPEFRKRVVLITTSMTGAPARIIRETLDESQEVFGTRIGTSPRTVRRMETQQEEPKGSITGRLISLGLILGYAIAINRTIIK